MRCPHCKGPGKYASPHLRHLDCEVCGGDGKVTEAEYRAYDERVDRNMRKFTRQKGATTWLP